MSTFIDPVQSRPADYGTADICRYRHDDVLDNMGLRGRKFTDKYENQVVEMKRSLLEFMKATRQRASETDPHVGPGLGMDLGRGMGAGMDAVGEEAAGAEPIFANAAMDPQIKMTTEGFPILPQVVQERTLSKKECEALLRTYLGQHYCKL